MGFDIPIVEGGFGEDSKIVSALTISKIHSIPLKIINQSINRLISKERLRVNIDYIDMFASNDLKVTASDLGWITSNSQKQCFILSERGYTKLIKYMDDDSSWDVMEQFIDEYFSMRKELNSTAQKKAQLLLTIYDGGQYAIVAAKQLTDLEKQPLLETIDDMKPKASFHDAVAIADRCIDVGEFSKILKKNNIDMGRNKLFRWLRDNKYLMSGNIPYQQYIDRKYFQVIEVFEHNRLHLKTMITGKGQIALLKKLLPSA